jgi:hypothetical protein
MTIAYRAGFLVCSATSAVVPVRDFTLLEMRDFGWRGSATVDPYPGQRAMTFADAFRAALDYDLIPDAQVVLALRTSASGATRLVRLWPSLITRVEAESGDLIGADDDACCEIRFCDPLTYLSQRPIWGAYRECSPGAMVGGAMSLAVGGDGRPTLTPVLPEMSAIRIDIHDDQLREALQEVPYAIAAGETLQDWLDFILGQLGVRIEMRGHAVRTEGQGQVSFKVDITLRDQVSSALDPVSIQVEEKGGHGARGMTVRAMHRGPPARKRGALLDNPAFGDFQVVGTEGGALETVLSSAGVGLEEAGTRAGFTHERETLRESVLTVVSAQPGLLPGRSVKLTNRPVLKTASWRVADVVHTLTKGAYQNSAELEKADLPWRPPPVRRRPVMISGVVDDGDSETGEPIARERRGQVPVRFCFFGPAEDRQSTESGAQTEREWPPRIDLATVESMAGGKHGFVSAHRQGDICRVMIDTPLYAEIVGFVYRDHQAIGRGLVDVSSGIVVGNETGDWQGMVFMPADDLPDEEPASEEEPVSEEVVSLVTSRSLIREESREAGSGQLPELLAPATPKAGQEAAPSAEKDTSGQGGVGTTSPRAH